MNDWMQYKPSILLPHIDLERHRAMHTLMVQMDETITYELNELWLDMADGPRLRPGRHEWRAVQPRRIRINDRRRHR